MWKVKFTSALAEVYDLTLKVMNLSLKVINSVFNMMILYRK